MADSIALPTYPRSTGMDARLRYGQRIPQFRHLTRQWPDAVLGKAPIMFSTDLRDGNQALPSPMTFDQKLRLFHLLVAMGFKEIEVAMPYSNDTEYNFVRHLIQTPGLIPHDVLIQVVTPCHEEAVQRTIECVQGAKQVILFTYLPGSDNFRETILGLSEDAWIERAREITYLVRASTKEKNGIVPTRWIFNFGFEDFANARLEAVVRCAEVVKQAWRPTRDEKMIFAVAASVETSMPNVFADQVERFCQTLTDRDYWRLSVHTHNDRGGAVAAAELATLAGADRLEGCLFGNGERAGNMDLVTFGLNMLTQGLCTGIDFSCLDHIRRLYEEITALPIHPRAPYSGTYSLRAFSGIHQDAILKGLKRRYAAKQLAEKKGLDCIDWLSWRVPYLPLDPSDIGRSMDDVIGISSQSGKAGIKWVVESCLGIDIPTDQAEVLAKAVKERSTQLARGLSVEEVCAECNLILRSRQR